MQDGTQPPSNGGDESEAGRECATEGCENEAQTTEPYIVGGEVKRFTSRLCSTCIETKADRASARVGSHTSGNRGIQERIDLAIPEDYQDFDPDKSPMDPELRAMIMNWQPGSGGIYISGETGKGKSRVAYQLIKKLIEKKHRVMTITDAELRHQVGRERMEGKTKTMDNLCTTKILYIDDFGQAKMTEAHVENILAIWEYRAKSKRDTIVTSNYSPPGLGELISVIGSAAPIVRRIKETTAHFRA